MQNLENDFRTKSNIKTRQKKYLETEEEISLNRGKSKSSWRNCFKNLLLFKIRILVALIILLLAIITCVVLLVYYERSYPVNEEVDVQDYSNLPEEQAIWYDKGLNELKIALGVKWNTRRAKNVILFIGDGMGPNTVTASRILKFKEEGVLTWERFPNTGVLKTYCADKQVSDSFSTATALFGGVKVNYETGGVDSTVHLGNCAESLKEEHHVQTIIKWAQDSGMDTGFVTTTRVTHATPAALYAHVPDRRWECEAKIPAQAKLEGCKDIARMLIENEIGKNINIIMGGGRQCLVSSVNGSLADPIDTWSCYSKDGRDLISDWRKLKEQEGFNYAVLNNNEDLANLDVQNTDYVLGIFANGHLKYDYERDPGPKGMPSLRMMVEKALQLLKNRDNGFLLVVEGGNIDQAHHRGAAKKALTETLALDEAVKSALVLSKDILEETLVIVTADHSHTLTINGYPDKGNNILGIASNSRADGISYTTLTYGTSNKGFQIETDKNNGPKRRDPSQDDTESFDYIQQSAIYSDENTHGGSDVLVHAIGPMAHLFHRVHEQSYVAHVISYALRIGQFRDTSMIQPLVDFLGL